MNIFSKNRGKLIPDIVSALQIKTPMSKSLGKVLTVAVGTGVLVSATGLILYHYLYGRQYIYVLERDLNKLSVSLADLRREFEELRSNKKIRSHKKALEPRRSNARAATDAEAGKPSLGQSKQNVSTASLLTCITDGAGSMYSAVESDEDDEDVYCDISDSASSGGGISEPEPEVSPGQEFSISQQQQQDHSSRRFVFTITPPVVSAATMNHAEAKEAVANTAEAVDFDQIDKLLEGNDEQKLSAYNSLLQINKKQTNDWRVLWRLARASHIVGTLEGTKGNQKAKQQHITQGVEYATKALELNPNDAKVHKWYAICIGARGQFSSTKEKIQDGYVYKDHVEKAIKIDPQDPTLYNLLGRFEYEVSSLSSMERRMASWLFSEVPKGSISEAIRNFQKAEKLSKKPWKENRLLLAKCFIHEGEYNEALQWLDKAAEVPVVTSEEKGFQEEIEKLIKKYNYYRDSK